MCLSVVTIVVVLCGWPRLKVFEMPMPQKAISVGTVLGIYILLICSSCSFYLLILRKRGNLRNNKVGNNISTMEVKESDSEMMTDQFGNVWIGDSHTNDAYNQDDQRQHSSIEEVLVFAVLINNSILINRQLHNYHLACSRFENFCYSNPFSSPNQTTTVSTGSKLWYMNEGRTKGITFSI
jgi:hypothetical protein